MKKKKSVSPPAWAQQFLEWYCRPEVLEDLQGDLNEYFDRNLKTRSPGRARLIYIIDVLKFFRSYTIRKPQFLNLLIQWIMIGSYIKTSARSIVRHKLFSAINIIGLAVSMSVGLLLIGMLADLHAYDRFHEHHGQIYRLISSRHFAGNKHGLMATSSIRAGKAIRESFTGVEDVAILRRGFNGDFQHQETTIPLSGYWANESFFNVFTFPLLQGNSATALKMPYSIVLTETSARKLFAESDAMGKTLLYNGQSYTITGIMSDVPKFSHLQFEMLGSLNTWEGIQKDNPDEFAWDNIWNAWVYVRMPDNPDLESFQRNLNKLSEKEDLTVKNTHIALTIQPLDDIMTGEQLGNQIGPYMGSTLLWVFSGLTFVVILSACFNYTNLSVARSLRRSREVGIRKVIGALKSHVIVQFVVEAVLISLLALVGAWFIFLLVKPHFINLHPDMQSLKLDFSATIVLCFIGFAVSIGLAAGFFPALFFAKINAVQVLKDVSAVRMFGKITMRKTLIVFQYCISLMLIIGTIIMYQQYKHYVAFDLGFSTKNILNISLQNNKPELLRKELDELPEVKGISQSVLITGVGNLWGAMVKAPVNPEDSVFVFANMVDENYIPLHNYQLLAGRNFTAMAEDAEESEVIVNQEILKRFNIAGQNPEKAIGESILVNGKTLRIAGVIKDFHYDRVNNPLRKEVMLRYSNKEGQYLNVSIQSDDLPGTYAKIQTIWKKIDPVHAFNAKFYDDQIEETFRGISASVKLAGFIAFLAICIASMGLLGMVVFTTETRLKEISIRKVLGASEGTLVFLLGRGFIIMLCVASLIAIPATYLFFEKVLFTQMANHVPLGIAEGLIGISIVMTIAAVMIGSQTLKVARSNPAEVLKNE